MEVGRRLALSVRHTAFDDPDALHMGPAPTAARLQSPGGRASGPHGVVLEFAHPRGSTGLALRGTANCTSCCARPDFEIRCAGLWGRGAPGPLEGDCPTRLLGMRWRGTGPKGDCRSGCNGGYRRFGTEVGRRCPLGARACWCLPSTPGLFHWHKNE